MIGEQEARNKVLKYLDEIGRYTEGGLGLIEDATVRKPYGWVFFYQSRRYLASGDIFDSVVGNSPIVILAADGEMIELGTALHPSESLANLERARGLL
jgi:hypothetical protein